MLFRRVIQTQIRGRLPRRALSSAHNLKHPKKAARFDTQYRRLKEDYKGKVLLPIIKIGRRSFNQHPIPWGVLSVLLGLGWWYIHDDDARQWAGRRKASLGKVLFPPEIPPIENVGFTAPVGFEVERHQLQSILDHFKTHPHQPVLIAGIGGAGKSTLARAVLRAAKASRIKHQSSLYWVFDAGTEHSFRASVCSLCQTLHIDYGEKEPLNAIWHRVLNRLCNKDVCAQGVLLFDNVNRSNVDAEKVSTHSLSSSAFSIDPYLQSVRDFSGHCVLTARDANLLPEAYTINLSPGFSDEEALALFFNVTGALYQKTDQTLVKKLLHEVLGNYPLGIYQAACGLKRTPRRLEIYLDLLQKQSEALSHLEERYPVSTGYPSSYRQVLTLSIHSLPPESRSLLHSLSLLAAGTSIPLLLSEMIFRQVLKSESATIPQDNALTLALQQCLAPIKAEGLVSVNNEDHSLQLHRVTQHLARSLPLGEADSQQDLLLEALGVTYIIFDSELSSALTNQSTLLPHMQAVVNQSSGHKGSLQTARMLFILGRLERDLGHFLEARKYYTQALALLERHYGKGQMETTGALNNLGAVEQDLGHFLDAKKYIEQVLAIDERHYGKGHVQTAVTLSNLGLLERNLGHLPEAKKYSEQALATLERHYGKGHLKTAVTLNNLGGIEWGLGQLLEARKYYRQALALLERGYGKGHVQTADALNNLGVLERDLGHFLEARIYAKQALVIYERHYGKGHVKTALALNCIGAVEQSLGHPFKAKKYYAQALVIFERHYGKGHVETAPALNNLGSLEQALGHSSEAKKYCVQALAIFERHYGKDHVQTAMLLTNLGNVESDLGHLFAARKYHEQALAIYKQHPEYAHHPNIVLIEKNLSQLEEKEGTQNTPGMRRR